MPFIESFGGKYKERENKTVIRVDIKKVVSASHLTISLYPLHTSVSGARVSK